MLQVHVIIQTCDRAVIHCTYEYWNLCNKLCSYILGRVLDERSEEKIDQMESDASGVYCYVRINFFRYFFYFSCHFSNKVRYISV